VRESRCVLLYTKPARPGRVKTRLIGELSPVQAADLHDAFLGDLWERLSAGDFELRVAWALAPGERMPAAPGPGFAQRGGDLGERLFDGLQRAARDHRWVAAVGSDHPDLPLGRVEEAFDRLASGAGVVLGPAADGGYYLVAAAAEALSAELFRDVPWSTGEVLESTVERCRRRGIEPALLAEGADVDTPPDLARLARRLAAAPARDATACPRTRELLRSWSRLSAVAP